MEQELSRRLLDFLDGSPSCYHAVDNLSRRLEAEGYERLREAQPWTLQSGGKYYVVRGDSTLAAFRIPAGSRPTATALPIRSGRWRRRYPPGGACVWQWSLTAA